MGNDNTADKQVKNRGHENIKPYQWKEGQSGNPAGRPKRKTLTELIHAKMDDTPEAWEAVVATVIHKMVKDKDNHIIKAFWEYTDGKPLQRQELTGKDGKDLPTPILGILTQNVPSNHSDDKAEPTE